MAQPAEVELFDIRLTVLLAILGELLAIVFVLHALTRGGAPSATLSWVIFILVFPYVGLVFYYLLPRRMSRRGLKKRAHRLAWIEDSLDYLTVSDEPAATHANPLARTLHNLDPDSVHDGNKIELIESGPEFFAEAARRIAAAKRFVHVQTYILRPDATGNKLIAQLTEAAARGVEVRLLYDSLGSWWLKAQHLKELVGARGKVCAISPLLWRRRPFNLNLRNHRKLVIVDGEVCFVGGRNIGDEYSRDRFGRSRRWLDSMMCVEGPTVNRLHRAFIEDWFYATEEDLAHRRYMQDVPPAGDVTAGVIASGPDRRESTYHLALVQMISMAQRTLDISSPYLVPHPTVHTALQVAAVRGVRVRIHTNGRQASTWPMYHAQRSYYPGLMRVGVEIHETTGDYNHEKLILVDGTYCFVGSPNLDVRSIDLNFEIGVVAMYASVADDALALFERRVAKSRLVTDADLPKGRGGRIADGFCRLLSPLL